MSWYCKKCGEYTDEMFVFIGSTKCKKCGNNTWMRTAKVLRGDYNEM